MTGSSGGGGSNTATTTTTQSPPPAFLNAYTNLVNQGQNLVSQPLQQYTAPLVAGFTPQQQQAMQTVQNTQGIGQPYINAAAQEFGQATTPLWPTLPQFGQATLDQFQSPYTTDVTNALRNLYNQQNATQQAQVQGNATARGAYGGDREAVAQALTSQQEQLAQAPTLAQVQQQGYQTALSEFNAQQQAQLQAEQANAWLSSQAGFGLAGLGSQAQNLALTGAAAELGTGGLQQQLGQEQLNIPYEQFVQQQAYPYQQLNFLEGLTTGAGSLAGGTGTTSVPGPSALSQAAGLGLAGAGLVGATGGFGSNGWVSNLFGGSNDPTSAFDAAAAAGQTTAADFSNVARGGRIGFASGGGLGSPVVGDTVPDISVSFIPPAAANPSFVRGLDSASQTQTNSSSGGGGGNPLGTALGVAGLGLKIASLFKDGGRLGYQDGGGLGTSTLPSPPAINLDWLVHPGPNVKQGARGGGPPQPPRAAPESTQETGILGGGPMQDLNAIGSLKKLGAFGDSSEPQTSASGGRIGYQGGGGLGTADVTAASPLSAADPNTQGLYQRYAQMSLEQLQELAARMPPGSQQGALVQRALQAKKLTGSGTAGASQSGTGVQVPMASGFGLGQSAQPAQGQGMAEGGVPGYVTEDEMDPHPIVDHSGDTVVVRYPSEGKVLDLGLPSIKGRGRFTAGGSSGASPGPSPLIGAGPASQFMSTTTAPNGVQLPQVSSDLFAGPGAGGNPAVGPGAGIGNWFNPLPQIGGGTTMTVPTTPIGMGATPAAAATAPQSWSDILTPLPPGVLPQTVARGGRLALAEGGDADDDVASAPLPPREVRALLPPKPDDHGSDIGTATPDLETTRQPPGMGELPATTATPAAPSPGSIAARRPDLAAANKRAEDAPLPSGGIGEAKPPEPQIVALQHDQLIPSPSIKTTGGIGDSPSGIGAPTPKPATSALGDEIDKVLAGVRSRNEPSSYYSSPWLPVMQAGFGMLASRSPFPGVALGEGGLQGVRALAQQQKELPENELRRAQASVADIGAQLLPLRMRAQAQAMLDDSNSVATGAQPGSAVAPMVSPASIDKLPPNMAAMADEWAKLGWTPAQISGYLGGGTGESGRLGDPKVDLDPKAVNKDSGAFGALQLLGSRKDAIFAFAKQNNLDPNDPRTQARFADQEIKSGNAGPGVLESWQAGASDPQKAAISSAHYERAEGYSQEHPEKMTGFDQRVSAAQSIHSLLGGGQGQAEIQVAQAGPDTVVGQPHPTAQLVSSASAGPGGAPSYGAPNLDQYDRQYQLIQTQMQQAQHELNQAKRLQVLDPDHMVQHQEAFARIQAHIAQLNESMIHVMNIDPKMQAPLEAAKEAARQSQIPHMVPEAGVLVMPDGRILMQSPRPVDQVITEGPHTGEIVRTYVYPTIAGARGSAQAGTPGVSPIPSGTSPAGGGGIGPSAPGQEYPIKLEPQAEKRLVGTAEAEVKAAETTRASAESAQNQMVSLNQMKQDASHLYTGPYEQMTANVAKYLRPLNPAKFDEYTASHEDFVKNQGVLVRTATHELSPRAAFQEVKFIEGQLPSPEQSPKGLERVLGEYQGLNDYKIAKAHALYNWELDHGGPGNTQGFEQYWNGQAPVTPYTFVIHRMPADERNNLYANLLKTDQGRAYMAKLQAEAKYAEANGLF